MSNLDVLDFGNKTLFVKLVDIYTDKKMMKGKFEITSRHNSLSDIQSCLASSINKQPFLIYAGGRCKVFITDVNFTLTEGENTCSYDCSFLANLADNITNKVLWDVGTNYDDSLDIQDIIGNSDIDVVAQRVLELIDKYKYYQPSLDCPFPSAVVGACVADDVAAILSGVKPAAIFDESELSDPVLSFMLKECQLRGYVIETAVNFGTTFNGFHSIVVGKVYHVRQIIEIMTQAVNDQVVSEYYYWRLGKLLGHPDDSLSQLVKHIKDLGFNRA